MRALARVSGDELFIQLHAQSGPVRKAEVAIHHLRVDVDGLLDPGVGEVVEVLLDLEVRDAGRQVDHGRGAHRPAHVMRRYQHVVRLRPGRQLARLQQSAEVRRVHLDDVASL